MALRKYSLSWYKVEMNAESRRVRLFVYLRHFQTGHGRCVWISRRSLKDREMETDMNELCRIHIKLSDCFPGSEAFCREMALGGIAITEKRDDVDAFTVVLSDDPAYLASFHGHVCCLLAERPPREEQPWQEERPCKVERPWQEEQPWQAEQPCRVERPCPAEQPVMGEESLREELLWQDETVPGDSCPERKWDDQRPTAMGEEDKPDGSAGFAYIDENWPVVMNLSDLTPSFIRLMLCHHRGDPYTIAETQRLLIRESCPDDYEKLCELAGEHSTMASREQFEAYIHLAYRFFGYGFWSVIDKTDGDVVGWCGFYPEVPHEAAEEPAESVRDKAQESVIAMSDVETGKTQEIEEIVIAMSDVETGKTQEGEAIVIAMSDVETEKTQEIEEMSPEPASEEALCLGYAIREPYRGKGYASESCRAVMRYGMEELGITVLHLWVKQDNGPSMRLASRLGFHLVRSGDLCLYEWREHESGI